MARPPHPLDESGYAAAGQGQEQAHEDLRLERADLGRRAEGGGDGQLFWVPESSKTPVGAIVALVVIVLLALAFVLVVRRQGGARAEAERRQTLARAGSGDAKEARRRA